MNTQIRITVETEAKPDDLKSLSALLDWHNKSFVESFQKVPLNIYARDESGNVVGGLSGFTVWTWLSISLLAVNEESRTLGIGSQLLETAELEARRRGCKHAVVDTFSFQARPFYEKSGYEVFGELTDFPPGHSRYYLRKTL